MKDIIELTCMCLVRIILIIIKRMMPQRVIDMELSKQQMARIFKAMGDENRLTILTLLHTGERCACRLQEALEISQPTLSHHMRILQDAGLVNARKDGKWIHYSLSEQGAQEAKQTVCEVLNIK